MHPAVGRCNASSFTNGRSLITVMWYEKDKKNKGSGLPSMLSNYCDMQQRGLKIPSNLSVCIYFTHVFPCGFAFIFMF